MTRMAPPRRLNLKAGQSELSRRVVFSPAAPLYQALQLGKAPSCLYTGFGPGRLGFQARKARATPIGQHNKPLLRPTDQTERCSLGLETRTEAVGRRPGPGPAGGSRLARDPGGRGGCGGEQHPGQRMP
jgi:hypothetical protein